MPDRSFLPRSAWEAEKDPSNAEIADHILRRLLPAATQLHRGNADELGVDPSMLAILEVLGVVRELPVAALADRVALSHAATSRAVTRLEERNWVERLGEPGELRVVTRAAGTTETIDASRQDVRGILAARAGELRPEVRDAVLGFLREVSEDLTVRGPRAGDRRLTRTLIRRRKEWDREERARRGDTP